jgi:hypothetical protein
MQVMLFRKSLSFYFPSSSGVVAQDEYYDFLVGLAKTTF